MQKSPYDVIKQRHITEKATVLENLKNATSNKCVARCENPKYVFLVDTGATKPEIKEAIEKIYSDKNVRVVDVNTILVKPKVYNRRGRMNPGRDTLVKKAIVTLEVGCSIDS